jgi:hypothetical protein
MQLAVGSQATKAGAIGTRIGGAHADTTTFEAFVYSKLWLSRVSPTLSVDSIEVEINILTAALLPLALAIVNCAYSASIGGWARSGAVIVGVATGLFQTTSVLRLRQAERWESVRNVVSDLAMRQAASTYSAPRSS